MATLRAHCPWDAAQTHESLAPYAVEEAYEVAEAAETGDRDALRSELGDLLLQVLFHAQVASEHPQAPFDAHDVAEMLAAKMRRRHPHVFDAAHQVRNAADVEASWNDIKKQEAGPDAGVLDGIPTALPALARAQKYVRRLRREGIDDAALHQAHPDEEDAGIGPELMATVLRAEDTGNDAEAALRQHLRHIAGNVTDETS